MRTTLRSLALLALLGFAGPAAAQTTPASGMQIQEAGVTRGRATIMNCDGTSVLCTVHGSVVDVSSTGGGGGGAPTTAHYVTTQAEAGLSAEFSLGSLTTGLVLNTVSAGVGTPSTYAGGTCTNQFVTATSASGALTCSTASLTGAQFANQGTTTTVLHGNAAGNPTFAAVSLTADVSGDLPLSSLAQASAASKLLGRGDSGAGDYQEITLGSGLTMTGTTLAASGGGSGTVTHTAGALTANQLVIGNAADDLKVLGALGTITTVLHGNAAGAPTFGAVSLTADVSGDLPYSSLAQGTALSVLGVAGNATADVASIVAANDGEVLRRSGTTVGFGTVANAGLANSSITVTGTANRVTVSGSPVSLGGTVTLNGPQDLHTAATPTFASGTLSANTNQLVLGTTNTTTFTMSALSAGRTFTLPNANSNPVVPSTCGGSDFVTGVSSGGVLSCGTQAGSGTVTTTGTPANGNLTKFTGATSISNADLTGDVTTAGGVATTLVNIPAGTTMAGRVLATAIAAPTTPAAGIGSIYVDSTSKNLSVKDDAGVVKHGVQTSTCGGSTFVNGVSDAGVLSCGTPAGSGDVTGPASSVDSEVAVFNSTTGKIIKRATGTGPAKLASGVLSASAVNLATEVTGTLPVANGGTGLTSGTSGGVLAYTATGTLASSGALTANLPVIGGGAGAVPTVGTRSGNTTAYVTTTGTQTSGDCVKIDANGNHVANGSACGGGGSSDTVAVVSSDVTLTESLTPADVTGLVLALAGSSTTEQWEFTCTVIANSNVAAADFNFNFTVPSGTTMLWSALGDQGVGVTQTPQVGTQGTTLASGLAFGGLSGSTALISLRGVIFYGGSSGNVQMQFALPTNPAGTQTIKALKGSWCRYAKLVS